MLFLKMSGCSHSLFAPYLSNKLYDLDKIVHGGFPWNNSTGTPGKEHISDAA